MASRAGSPLESLRGSALPLTALPSCRIDRPNVRQHISFGHGIHTCPGAPLARAEAGVVLQRLFDRTKEIRVSVTAHGPAGTRRYDYLPTYMIRGLTKLNLEFG